MSEKDLQGIIIPPKYSLPTSSQTEPKFINITESFKPPSTTIIFSKTENMAQFVITAKSYVTAIDSGAEMSLNNIPNATTTTGDIAVKVTDIPLPNTLKNRQNGIIINERGTFAWQGNNNIIITPIDSPSHPITGDEFIPPNISEANNILSNTKIVELPQFQSQSTENLASHIGSGTIVSQHDADLLNNPYLNPELKKAA